jgi:hypothetical protein
MRRVCFISVPLEQVFQTCGRIFDVTTTQTLNFVCGSVSTVLHSHPKCVMKFINRKSRGSFLSKIECQCFAV